MELFENAQFIAFFELYRAECSASIAQLRTKLEKYHAKDLSLVISTLELWSITQVTKIKNCVNTSHLEYILDRFHNSSSVHVIPDNKSSSFAKIPANSLDLAVILSNSTKRLIIELTSIHLFKQFLPDLDGIIELAVIRCPDLCIPGQLLAKHVYEICGRPNAATESIYRTLVMKCEDANWPQLKHLDLSNCQLTQLDLSLFRLTPNLEYLDLSNNQITSVDKTCFYDNSTNNSLKSLDLSGNRKLEKLPTMYLLTNLEKLVLHNTMISDVSFLTDDLKNLRYLDLSDCKITSFEFLDGLKLLRGLEHIILCNNPIEVILEYRCKLIAYCTWRTHDRKSRKLVVDERAVKISEMRTADVIAAVKQCETEIE